MAKIEKVLEESIWLSGMELTEAGKYLLSLAERYQSYGRLKLRELECDDGGSNLQLIGIRDETPAEIARREADAIAAECRELDAAKAKVAEIEARLAGK